MSTETKTMEAKILDAVVAYDHARTTANDVWQRAMDEARTDHSRALSAAARRFNVDTADAPGVPCEAMRVLRTVLGLPVEERRS